MEAEADVDGKRVLMLVMVRMWHSSSGGGGEGYSYLAIATIVAIVVPHLFDLRVHSFQNLVDEEEWDWKGGRTKDGWIRAFDLDNQRHGRNPIESSWEDMEEEVEEDVLDAKEEIILPKGGHQRSHVLEEVWVWVGPLSMSHEECPRYIESLPRWRLRLPHSPVDE